MARRAPARTAAARLEVHEHLFSSGPGSRAGYRFDPATRETTWRDDRRLTHSHEDGSTGHTHPETGPGKLTIDKDDWYRATGLKGGGRKKYTVRPSGLQLAYLPRTAEEQTFTVVFVDEYSDEHVRAGISLEQHQRARDRFKAAAEGDIPEEFPGQPGDGGAAVANVALSFDMTPVYEYHGPRRRRGGTAAT